jgi:dTDP-4-amino-4,6-dideoxygalactose transaminase
MSAKDMTRRGFLKTTAAGATGMSLAGPAIFAAAAASESAKPAILGGKPLRTGKSPSWPVIGEGDDEAWTNVFHARKWFNDTVVQEFEAKYAALTGTKFCVATNGGTTALHTSLVAVGVGPGDEVLVPPYTFVATVNVVLLQFAIPVFVDTDRQTFQIDAKKLEEKITDRTRCILPVHLGGNPADMDTILAVAKKRNLPVVEDACQAHLAEWRGKKVGSLGDTGGFSFQVTKNLCSGEGGAIISNNEQLIDRCFSFHTNGRERSKAGSFSYQHSGTNVRMTEFQAALLLRGMTRVEKQSQTRSENAAHLTAQLEKIPGIQPAKMYDGATRNAYHLYMFRYDKDQFAGLTRDKFMRALSAEGISCMKGYSPLNKEPFLKDTLYSRGYLNVFSRDYVDKYFKNSECPENDRLCEEAVWFTQTMFLGTKGDMDEIAEAIRRIQANAAAVAKV